MIYNPFEHVSIGGLVLPDAAVGKLLKDPVALALYVYVLGLQKQQRRADRTVTAHVAAILEAVDVSKPVFTAARRRLKSLGVADSDEGSKRGMWDFRILHPDTGQPLPVRPRDNVDFVNVSDWVALEFYRRQMPESELAPGRFSCPFCISPGAPFTVTLEQGSEAHGTWTCRKCREGKDAGSFIAFYIRKNRVNYGTAIGSVNAILHGLILEEQHRHEQGLPEPGPPASISEWEQQMMAAVGIERGDPSII